MTAMGYSPGFIRNPALRDLGSMAVGRVNGGNAVKNTGRMTINDHSLPHLSGAAAGLGYVVARPRIVAIASIIGLTVLGWLWLGMIAVRQPDLWQALCSAAPAATLAEAAPLLAMWGAMTLAMMIPGAAPMILTYAEIADTAARQRQHVVSPLVLAAGYVTVWTGFAGVTTLMQIGLAQLGAAEGFSTPLGRAGAGAVFIVAGLYQFSSLKDACLRLCRQPFQFFFTNWATTPGGVFKLGLRQGAHCLGCC